MKLINVPGVQGMEEPGYPREGCQAAKASLRDGDFRVRAQDSRTGQRNGEGQGGAGCLKMERVPGSC